uniref:Uncharacterized protein n=1 Tax=Siphovirus contig89 TaxID=1518022 RepID=A0A075EH42_9CAUD|nr:hypothetical protein [Siphovirus contig89]AIE38425.1 hypothetical protein [Siphovirus contig89]AIE38468.1 hypothetical protein [Siphovirus contig89]AIE38511.1 hypothetical protein [Siphovirus contig89]AIE38554.1 hypothetical protein [Siphovirus contig89]
MPHPQYSLDVVLEGDNRLPRARLTGQYAPIPQVLHRFDLMGPQINRSQGSVLFSEYLDVWIVHVHGDTRKVFEYDLVLDSIPNGCHETAVCHVGQDIEDTLLLVYDLIPSADDQNDVARWNHDVFLSMSYSDGRIQMVVRWLTSSFCSHSRAEKVMMPPSTNRKYQTVQPVSSYSAQRSLNSALRMSFPYSQIRIYGSCPSLCGLLYSLTTELLGR